jgi:hypothetical protein
VQATQSLAPVARLSPNIATSRRGQPEKCASPQLISQYAPWKSQGLCTKVSATSLPVHSYERLVFLPATEDTLYSLTPWYSLFGGTLTMLQACYLQETCDSQTHPLQINTFRRGSQPHGEEPARAPCRAHTHALAHSRSQS